LGKKAESHSMDMHKNSSRHLVIEAVVPGYSTRVLTDLDETHIPKKCFHISFFELCKDLLQLLKQHNSTTAQQHNSTTAQQHKVKSIFQ
jgi:hypothetical protein